MSRPVLGYWNIRGLAQPIRLLLAYVGQDFEDKYYECGPGPEYNKDCWFNEKFTVGLDFPNLPYYIDGDVKLTQSLTIIKYLARKHGLCGDSEQQHIRLDLAVDEAVDFKRSMTSISYNRDFETLKQGFVKPATAKLKEVDKFLGSNRWFAGDKLTYADFLWYETLEVLSLMEPSLLTDCSNLNEFRRRFQALPSIKQYVESDQFLSHPINNKMAAFGNV